MAKEENATPYGATSERGLQGFKQSEFLGATPEKVFGSDVRLEELPDGVRLFLREKRIDLSGKKVVVNVYRIVNDGGLKDRRVWVCKFDNRKPEDHEIAERCGGGSFIWMMKWLGVDSQERGILSEQIEIDEELGRAIHEEWKRRNVAPVGSPPSGSIAAPAPSAQTDMLAFMQMMDRAEEKTLARIERIAGIFRGNQNENAGTVLQEAYKGANEMMMKAVQTNIQMAKASASAVQEQMRQATLPAPIDEDEELPPEGPKMPSWLEPFFPYIESGLSKLLQGGPVAAAVKTMILSSEQWKEIFNDPEKWGQAVAAMEQHFGSDQTKKALDMLLNRRDDKAGSKRKGK